MERQEKYTIMEGYNLPSRGEIYDKPVNAHVELRSMTARDEMKRLSPSVTPLKTLADIIEGCMLEKPAIKVYDMCLGDYEYLLHKLRVVSYGSKYAITVGCPHCDELVDTEADLDALEVKEFDLDEFNELRNITLPKSDRRLTLRVQTPRMIDDLDLKVKEMKRKFKNASVDFESLLKITMAIDLVDGNKLGQIELENFVNNLPALDFQKLTQAIDKLNAYVGINTAIDLTCDKCGGDIRTYFRFGSEFFRPTNI
jgi:hypothetical protein